jgi:hypothetical protein
MRGVVLGIGGIERLGLPNKPLQPTSGAPTTVWLDRIVRAARG